MSWFSDLTGKAGAFLDRMDQVAASSLQEAGIGTPSKSGSVRESATTGSSSSSSLFPKDGSSILYEPTTTTAATTSSSSPSSSYHALNSPKERGAAVAQVLVGSASGSAYLTTSTPKPSAAKSAVSATGVKSEHRKATLPTDDSIFEFLNAPNTSSSSDGSGKKAAGKKRATSSSRPHSAASSSEEKPHPISTPTPTTTTPVQKQPPPVQEGTWRVDSPFSLTPSGKSEDSAKDSPDTVPEVEEEEEEDGKNEPKEAKSTAEVKEMVDGNVIEEDATPDHNSTPANADVTSDNQKMNEEGEGEGERAIGKDSLAEATLEELKKKEAELEEWRQKVSSLSLENKLLKREVSSLNEEMSTAMLRVEEVTNSKDHYQSEIHALREQASRSDHMIRQLRSQEEDLQASVAVRDSQIEVLRTQLSAADRALDEANERVAISKKEQERLLQDANLSSGAQNQALDSLKAQLSQTLAQLTKEREEHEAEKQGYIERESLLQSERTQLSDSLAGLQRQLAAEQSRTRECQLSSQAAQREVQTLRKEHEDYKQRATGILQAKEKLISSLQQGGEGGAGREGDARLQELRLEKEHVQEQLTNALRELNTARKEIQDMEERSAADMDGVVEQVRVCEGVLAEEKKQHAKTREEMARLSQELEIISEDLVKEKTKRREDKEASEMELATLKVRMNSLAPGREELEARLRELTENLIQKQTTLNTLNSEKSSLNIQLQRLQSELSRARSPQAGVAAAAQNAPQTAVQMNGLESTAGEGPQPRSMASVIPSLDQAPADSRLHKVRKAVNVVDRTSIRLGTFLKRYPQARLFTLLYMLLLHVWVMVVMLTYSPEVHDANDPGLHTAM